MITHYHVINWQGQNGASLSNTVVLTGNAEINLSESIANASTDLSVAYAIAHAALQAFYMTSDQAVSVAFNAAHGGSPLIVIALAAGVPYEWNASSGIANPFSSDVTGLFINNSSGSAANFNIRSLRS